LENETGPRQRGDVPQDDRKTIPEAWRFQLSRRHQKADHAVRFHSRRRTFSIRISIPLLRATLSSIIITISMDLKVALLGP
jgi:hypothetical protein